MKSNQEFKNQSLAALKGNWGKAVLVTLLFLLAVEIISGPATYKSLQAQSALQEELASHPSALSALSSPEYMDLATSVSRIGMLTTLLMILIVYPGSVGFANSFRKLLTGETDLLGNTIAIGFKSNYGRKVLTMFWMQILIGLWTLLLIIPGIIKAYSYAMTPFILDDNPELQPVEAIHRSRMMMRGHKFDLFWLQLSFIGWGFLCIFTLFIGFLWLIPYMECATAAFYENVKADYAVNGGLD